MEQNGVHDSDLLQFFEYRHLPARLAEVSSEFYVMAHHLVKKVPSNSERSMALRKLLEAKDCAVRAAIIR